MCICIFFIKLLYTLFSLLIGMPTSNMIMPCWSRLKFHTLCILSTLHKEKTKRNCQRSNNCFLNFRQNIYMDNPNLKYVIKFVDNVQEIELQNHNNYLRAKVALIFSKHTHTECWCEIIICFNQVNVVYQYLDKWIE